MIVPALNEVTSAKVVVGMRVNRLWCEKNLLCGVVVGGTRIVPWEDAWRVRPIVLMWFRRRKNTCANFWCVSFLIQN